MPFGALSSTQKITVFLSLVGGPRYVAGTTQAAAATTRLGGATAATGLAMRNTTRRTFAMNQALFTLHRMAFLGTTVVLGLGAAMIKLGFSYNSALDQARAALSPLFKDTQSLNDELQRLFKISKYSPFVLADMTNAFRKMFPAFKSTGMGLNQINRLTQAMVDTLSFAGKTTPANLQQMSYAFQHMFFQGRLTGRLIQQLSSAGVNVHEILRRLGVQGQNLSNIARLNISPQRFTQAFLEVSNLPGVRGAAFRLSTRSFAGAMQVLRDSVSQFMGLMISGNYNRGKSALIDLIKPGGPLDRLINIEKTRGRTAAVFEFSRMITGSTAFGKVLVFIAKLIKDVGRFFVTIWVPAFAQALGALIVFYPALKTLDEILNFLSHHAKIARILFTLLSIAFIVTYGRAILAWTAMRLLNIALFGQIALIRKLLFWLGVQNVEIIAAAALWWSLVEAEYASAGALAAVRLAIFSIPIIGWLLLIISLLVTMFIKWHWFHVQVVRGANAIGDALRNGIIKPLQHMERIIDRLTPKIPVIGGLGGFVAKSVLHSLVPVFATGGVMPHTGPALVGERGPELVQLPAGARVTPIQRGSINLTEQMGNLKDVTIHTHLHVDRREIANAVARVNQDKLARR
jgi:hypothetical protein